jgi:hypothetical protein
MTAVLIADRDAIAAFVLAVFLRAQAGFLSLRTFLDGKNENWRPDLWRHPHISGNGCFDHIIDDAFWLASQAAAAVESVVFAPAAATFVSAHSASEKDVKNGLALAVELDERPLIALEYLEDMLGPATVVVASGGIWIDPETGEAQEKLHPYWRLREPTGDFASHVRLKEARRRLARLVGADPTGVPLCHGYRWPGTAHKKAAPKLARILELRSEIEIDLDDAYERIERAEKEPPSKLHAAAADEAIYTVGGVSGPAEGSLRDLAAALEAIGNDNLGWPLWNRYGMALWRATGGSQDGFRLFDEWSKKSAKYDADETEGKWENYDHSPPERLGAGTLFYAAKQADLNFEKPSARERRERREAELAAFDARQPPGVSSYNEDDHDTSTSWTVSPAEEPWPEIEAEAFHGLAGDIVDAIDPLTEADPIAVLVQLLVMSGSALGPEAWYRVGNTRHHANLYAVICGDTSKARKGTSYDPVEYLLREADSDWAERCVKSGLSSGEGVVHAVHDDIWTREKVNHGKDNPPTYEDVLKYESVADKRLLITEAEFASPLSVMQRQGNSLSPVLRLAWDGRKLQTLTKQSPETATGAHVSVIGHITIEELRAQLDRVSMANGFGNRILFALARRSKELPFPGWLDDATRDKLAAELGQILNNTVLRREITFAPETRDLWVAEYHELSAAQPGLFGFLVARAEAQVLRLSMIYALLHETYYIEPAHLRAALAFWRYCEASVKYIFGDMLGDPVADELLATLRQAGPGGMTRTELGNLFEHHRRRLAAALALLLKHGKVRVRKRTGTGGRAAEIWIAT